MADFNVSFEKDNFDVTFGAQGPQGPAGTDSEAVPYDATRSYDIGVIVYSPDVDLFSSKIANNVGNPLTDTDAWVALGIASGVVSQLNDLTDVSLSSPSDNQILRYNGSNWVNDNQSSTDYLDAEYRDFRTGDDPSFYYTNGTVRFDGDVQFQDSVSGKTGRRIVITQGAVDLQLLPSLNLVRVGTTGFQVATGVYRVVSVAFRTTSDIDLIDIFVADGPLEGDDVVSGPVSNNTEVSLQITKNDFGHASLEELTNVSTTDPLSNQVLTWNNTDSIWEPRNPQGGGNQDNSRLGLSLSPTSSTEGSGNVEVTATLSIVDPVDSETISNEQVTVKGPDGTLLPVTTVSALVYTFTVDRDIVGNYIVEANATFTNSGVDSPHHAEATFRVQAAETDWYFAALTFSPTVVADLTNAGEYSPGVTTTFTADGDGLHRFYIAVPTRTDGYDFYGTPNFFVEFTDTPEVSGFTTDNYTLYAIDDIDDNFSGTQPVYVEEA